MSGFWKNWLLESVHEWYLWCWPYLLWLLLTVEWLLIVWSLWFCRSFSMSRAGLQINAVVGAIRPCSTECSFSGDSTELARVIVVVLKWRRDDERGPCSCWVCSGCEAEKLNWWHDFLASETRSPQYWLPKSKKSHVNLKKNQPYTYLLTDTLNRLYKSWLKSRFSPRQTFVLSDAISE